MASFRNEDTDCIYIVEKHLNKVTKPIEQSGHERCKNIASDPTYLPIVKYL